jgi:hypothetical protein
MLDVDRILEEVAYEVGATDFGDETAIEGLRVLADSAARESQLNPMGWATLEAICRQGLANRLRILDWHRRNPAAAEIPVEAPIFIVGASRTGTTALSHLLTNDPDCRAPRHFEVANSLPPPKAETYWDDPRLLAEQAAAEHIHPDFKAIHYDPPEASIECTQILTQHFASLQYPCMFNVPTYDEWLLSCDMRPAYRFHRQMLQLLQSEYPGRWHLKAPDHALHLEALFAIYPDARFVMTHRDPVQAAASACSLAQSLTSVFSDADQRAYIAGHWPDISVAMFDRLVNFRERHPEAKFVDVPYRDFIGDPMAVVRGIYDGFGLALTKTTEMLMRDHIAHKRQHQFGKHTYALSDFGLNRSALEGRFTKYLDRFDILAEAS